MKTSVPPLQNITDFCQSTGFTPVTIWRYRQAGWLRTLNINGRVYIAGEEIERFKQRAANGEFAKRHPKTKTANGEFAKHRPKAKAA